MKTIVIDGNEMYEYEEWEQINHEWRKEEMRRESEEKV